jgi:phage baseplate assembly protein W
MPFMNGTDIIGSGWNFPINMNAKGRLSYSSGTDRVRNAIWIILATSLGERVMREDFGAGATDYVFQSNSDVVRTQLATAVRTALTKWEPRINLVNVGVQQGSQASQVLIVVDYQIRSTNQLFNLVYPLYLQEGPG